jgi:Ribbon-helix-helix protein, copG family
VWHVMEKTTLYLPDELKERVEAVARAGGRSEADVIRDAIAVAVAVQKAPEPQIPLPGMSLGDSSVAERACEMLDGFGERSR